jgi:hypothetical protein
VSGMSAPDSPDCMCTPLHTRTASNDETELANSNSNPIIEMSEEPEVYCSVIPVDYCKVYGIPFILMRSHHYGALKVFLTVSSIISYFVVSVVSPSKHFFADRIITYTIEYIGMSWIVAPFNQTYDWVPTTPKNSEMDPEQNHPNNLKSMERKKRCCCRNGQYVRKPPAQLSMTEPSTRYIPFSIYNDVFMMLNVGFKLNPDLNENIGHFPAHAHIFIQSVIYRGLLNFFLFLNALFQCRLVLRNEHESYWGMALTINSLLVCTLNLQAYLWAAIFCVLWAPYLVYIVLEKIFMTIFCFSATSADKKEKGTKKVKKGTYLYNCLVFVWKRVNF